MTGAQGAQGPRGLTGPAGADGGTTVAFGNGGGGALNVTSDRNWVTNPPVTTAYTSCNIAFGATLTVPSGTIIRCSGNFTNTGTINVQPWIAGERWAGNSDPVPSVTGNTLTAPTVGEGGGGFPIASSTLRLLLNPGYQGFANGGHGSGGPNNDGGAAGGTLVIRVGGTFSNAGTINARGGAAPELDVASDAAAGSGGGGGGFVVIASASTMSNSGQINVSGGAGSEPGAADDDHGGGGGGGGLIHLLAPNALSVAGTLTVSGGGAASYDPAAMGADGGGGGAGAGAGGAGGTDGVAPVSGSAGLVLRTALTDVASLF